MTCIHDIHDDNSWQKETLGSRRKHPSFRSKGVAISIRDGGRGLISDRGAENPGKGAIIIAFILGFRGKEEKNKGGGINKGGRQR